MLFGNVENFSGEFKNRVVELTGQGANAQYLTWSQVPDTVKFEVETLLSQMRVTLIRQMMPTFISVAPMFANWK